MWVWRSSPCGSGAGGRSGCPSSLPFRRPSIGPFSSQGHLERPELSGGGEEAVHSLGAASSTVSFICRLIISMGHSHPPVVLADAPVPLLWTQDVAQGQRAQAVSPQAGRGSALTFLRPPSAASPPFFGPPTQPPKHHLPGTAWHPLQLATGSAPTPLVPGPVLPPACPPTPWREGRGVCPPLTESALMPGACHLHSRACWEPGCPRLGLSLLPP